MASAFSLVLDGQLGEVVVDAGLAGEVAEADEALLRPVEAVDRVCGTALPHPEPAEATVEMAGGPSRSTRATGGSPSGSRRGSVTPRSSTTAPKRR